MAYAKAEDLRRFLRIPEADFSDEDREQAELLIELAQGTIDAETGQSLESSTDTVVLDGPTSDDQSFVPGRGSKRLVLPRWPVTAVTSVTLTEDGTELIEGVDYTWSASGVIYRRNGWWPSHQQAIEVVYTAGYQVIPAGVKRIALRLAAGAWSNPGGALTQESLGDHSRSFAAETLGMQLSEADKRTLSHYKART